MTIKFSEETIREAQEQWSHESYIDSDGIPRCWRIATAVFEAAANAQVKEEVDEAIFHSCGHPLSQQQYDRIANMLNERYRNSDNGDNTRDCVGETAPEPFVVGKRYRTRGGDVARVESILEDSMRVIHEG